MILGIEIGGTKLQLGVAESPGAPLLKLERRSVDRKKGREGIVDQIREAGSLLVSDYNVDKIGIGFGGPVDAVNGRVIKSHHVEGWEGFDLVAFCQDVFNVQAVVDNDCNVSALAEATNGAGSGHTRVFYVTVGTGIGGGLVVDGSIVGSDRPTICELGHLRPDPLNNPELIVEYVSSGPSIAANAVRGLQEGVSPFGETSRLKGMAGLTAKDVADAAKGGDGLAAAVVSHGVRTLGWAIGQVINIVAPHVVVVGGGVSLAGEDLFYNPLRQSVEEFIIDPLKGSYKIVPPVFGEDVVVQGAIALTDNRIQAG